MKVGDTVKIGVHTAKVTNILQDGRVELDHNFGVRFPYLLETTSEFCGVGYKSVTNLGGYEVEISLSNDAARFRLFGDEVTDWSEIEFDEDGRAYCNTCVGRQYLDEYLRY